MIQDVVLAPDPRQLTDGSTDFALSQGGRISILSGPALAGDPNEEMFLMHAPELDSRRIGGSVILFRRGQGTADNCLSGYCLFPTSHAFVSADPTESSIRLHLSRLCGLLGRKRWEVDA